MANPDVVAAYFRPNVDKSKERFRWKSVDVEKVRALLYVRLGWDDAKFERVKVQFLVIFVFVMIVLIPANASRLATME